MAALDEQRERLKIMATLDTYATEGDLPTGSNGDMAYVTATDRIYLNDSGTWRYWDNEGVAGVDAGDLAYTGAKTGNPTSGTNYVITAQPDCHYDAAKYVTLSASAATLGGAVDDWGDRSGNDNDAIQTAEATWQPTYVKNQGKFGLQWPSSKTLGRMETSYTPASTPPGHTIVVAATPPVDGGRYLSTVVDNQGAGGALNYQAAGMKMPAYGATGTGPMIQSVNTTANYDSTKPFLATGYKQVFTIYDYHGDQKIFTNLEEVFTGSVSYTQGNIDTRLQGVYWLGGNTWNAYGGSFGQTGLDGHGGIMYEVLIFTTALSYTSDGTNLTGGNLKIVVDYLMNKYGVTTNYINSAS